MTGLKEALLRVRNARQPAGVSLDRVSRAANEVRRRLGERTAEVSEPEPLGDFQRRVGLGFARGGIAELSLNDLRRAPEGLWAAPWPLDEIEDFPDRFFDRLRAEPMRSVMRNLVGAYVRMFPVDRPSFGSTASFIASELPNYPKLPSYNAGLGRGLLSGREGAEAVGRILLEPAPSEVLKKLGIGEQHWQSPTASLVEHGFRRACELCLADKGGAIDPLVEFARLPVGGFRYPASQPTFARMILEPWLKRDPPDELRKQLQRLLIGFFGDPRMARERWTSVPSALTGVLIRWLTRGSIEEFLGVVDRSLQNDAHERRMWSFRRAFWMAYLDAGLINEAWVVFSRRALSEARNARMTGFGEREDGSDPRSVLIIRIGDATVVEWSHNGRCWIWPKTDHDDNPSSKASKRPADIGKPPRLYQKAYLSDALRHAPIYENHMGAETYSWQSKVAEHLYKLTGRRMKQVNYALKRH